MDDRYIYNYSIAEKSMRPYTTMQMWLALSFLAFFLAGCSGDQKQPKRVTVLAYDVCVLDIPLLKISSAYSEDFAAGAVSHIFDSREASFDFYLGNFPDTSDVISEHELSTDNPSIAYATEQRHDDGHFTVAAKLKERESGRKMLVFRGRDSLSKDPAFLLLLQKIRRCRIEELR